RTGGNEKARRGNATRPESTGGGLRSRPQRGQRQIASQLLVSELIKFLVLKVLANKMAIIGGEFVLGEMPVRFHSIPKRCFDLLKGHVGQTDQSGAGQWNFSHFTQAQERS